LLPSNRISNRAATVVWLILVVWFAGGTPTAMGSVLTFSLGRCLVADSGQGAVLELFFSSNSLSPISMEPASRPPSEDPELNEGCPTSGLDGGQMATSSVGGNSVPMACSLTQELPILTQTGWLYQQECLRFPIPPVRSLLKIPIHHLRTVG
jgi:hypothetical protein